MTSVPEIAMPMPMFTLRNKQWYYKGEGNMNVVLAVPADGTVVRVMKEMSVGSAESALYVLVRYRDALGRLFFADCRYTDVPVPMSMSADELRDIDQSVLRYRPANRRHKGLGWAAGLVAVSPDYTVLPPSVYGSTSSEELLPPQTHAAVYCVEVKPKQGWLHAADRAARNDSALSAKCVFCAHQYLKLSRGEVREISRYCSLDLFSGYGGRVSGAVRDLFRTPQNNLKMFADGVPVDERDFERTACQEFGDVGRMCAFIAVVLLGGGKDEKDATQEEEDTSREVRMRCNFDDAIPMPQHCVLHKILTMQKMQTTGFETVISAYERSAAECTTQFDHVNRLFSVPCPQAVLSPVDGYLVAATARDCSVFVTFSRIAQDHTEQQHSTFWFGHVRYSVCIKVSDLDPKPMSTIEKHRKQNADVLLAYKQYLDQGYLVNKG